MKIKDFIKMRREELGLSQEQVANACGVSKGTISRWEGGEIENMKRDKIKYLANILRVKPSSLIEDEVKEQENSYMSNEFSLHFCKIPLYSSISCGTGMFVDDNIEDYIAVPDKYIRPNHEYFANTACGDSMIGKGIEPGNVLIFEKVNILDNGQIGAFCINDEDAVCKVFRKLSSGIILLESANPKYEPIEIDLMKDDCFKIVGKLVGSFRQY